jgi:hypothetical protein
MINRALIIVLLAIAPLLTMAQKAYETAGYSGKVKGKTISFKLANGYIGASEISLKTPAQKTPALFRPESGAPDSDSQLTFKADKATAGYFILKNMQDAYDELPVVIYGVFVTGNQKLPVKLVLDKNI